MTHVTVEPKYEIEIPNSEDLTQWEVNILKMLLHHGETEYKTLIQPVLYSEDRLEQSVENLESYNLIIQTERDGRRYYNLNTEKFPNKF